ncbi:hypothetical protein [Amycolatopsis sacchari]|uniref:hypothetical protein n=1 Tax=Amycolatopsis sacchari TaxID=115433 RepID=UPI003D755240
MSIAILTSGVALGVHVPGLLLARRLAEAGVPSRVDVLQNLMSGRQLAKVPATKIAFHRDFRFALAGTRLANRNAAELDPAAVEQLLADWAAADIDLFVILSGFWVPVAYRYAAAHPGTRVHACHVDSMISPSFTAAVSRPAPEHEHVGHRDVWLLEERNGSVARTIPVSRADPVPWPERTGRLLAHGGGWGMGTYLTDAEALITRGFGLDIVTHEPGDLTSGGDGRRYFMIDPNWQPWQDTGFPPFGLVGPDGHVDYRRGPDHHDGFHLVRQAHAVVTKPGGGTLMDSLAAATPIVLLEPFGEHEAHNARLWERLGFGIAYDDWARDGYSRSTLEELHRNLLAARPRVVSYADELAGNAG